MIKTKALRNLREARIRESMRHGTDLDGYRAGCLAFLRELHEDLGVRLDDRGRSGFHTDDRGLGVKKPGTAHMSEFSLRGLAESIHGHDWVEENFHPSNGLDFGDRRLLEAALDPTEFLNVSTLNVAVSGLLNAEIMERFSNPKYIGRELIRIYPTKMNGHKIIGAARISPVSKTAKGRQPGEQHGEVGFSEQYKYAPETVEQALKIKVTKEAYYFDHTGQVEQTAGEVGDELAYGQDKDIADGLMGVQNLPGKYNLNGNSYEAYQTLSPFANDQSNQFQDVGSVDRARQQMVGATDPVTGREIQIDTFDILCFPFQELRMRNQLFGPNVQIGTQMSAGGFPTMYTTTGNNLNAVGRGTYRLIPLTAVWRNRALASDGLNLAGNVADLYWWVGDFKKACQWDENWPLTAWTASADEMRMKDEGLVSVHGANYRGQFFFTEPRYAYRQRA